MSRLHWTRPFISSSLLVGIAPRTDTVSVQLFEHDDNSLTATHDGAEVGSESERPCVPSPTPSRNGREVDGDCDGDGTGDVSLDASSVTDPIHRHTVELDDNNFTNPPAVTGLIIGADQLKVSLLPTLSVMQLKDLCRRHRLKCSGRKADLIDRLYTTVAAEETASAECMQEDVVETATEN